SEENPYPELERKGKFVEEGFKQNIEKLGIKLCQTRVGSMSCLFFTEQDVVDFATANTSDSKKYGVYFHAMLERGIYLAPSQYEAMFISIMHTDADLEKTVKGNYEALKLAYNK
ncbi:MAG: aspartate aminotransferase family protein, partial [Chlorobiales bacterium]|nr:aspartate aminotransferase family protein [Chlorobiales bacterium]